MALPGSMKMKFLFQFLLLLALSFEFTSCKRNGLKSNTIHFPRESDNERYGAGTRIVSLKTSEDSDLLRKKRSATQPPSATPPTSGPPDQKNDPERLGGNITRFNLSDGHHQLMVHWAGKGSPVILALAKDLHQSNLSNSSLYISYNYGKDFIRKSDQDVFNLGCHGLVQKKMVIERFYHNSEEGNAYAFADTLHNAIMTTTDSGRTFSRHCLSFKPDQLSLNPRDHRVVLSYDKNDASKTLYVSLNFGITWRIVDRNVKSFFWGIPPYDNDYDLYVERIEPYGGNKVLKYLNVAPTVYSGRVFSSVTIIDRVQDFEVRGNYMFATKKVVSWQSNLSILVSYDREPFMNGSLEDDSLALLNLLGSKLNSTLQFWVSSNRGQFFNAELPGHIERQDFYVVDASEDQVMLCINHNKTLTNLYVSEVHGSKFVLSLERVVYFNPEGVNKDTWLRWFTDESFVDVHKVSGLRGIFIASQLLNTTTFSPYAQRSLITFNKGGRWHNITAPQFDINGKDTNCRMNKSCSLHLSQKLTQFYPGTHATPILSRESAPGLVIGTGMLGASMNKTRMEDIFLSTNGGLTWNLVLQGHYIYEFGDHGGLIVAVLMFRLTREIRYSWNEGETWNSLVFSNNSMYIYGLLTEPGEMSTIFSVFGSKPGIHQWVIIQVNLRNVFPYVCNSKDYKMWSPSDEIHKMTYMPCLMGKKSMIERRIPHAQCFNGRHYERSVTVQNCSCTAADFECDFGFKPRNMYTWQCITDPESGVDPHMIPRVCKDFYYRSRGYRKIAGDTCVGGDEHRFMPDKLTCPEREEREFILYTRRTSIHRYDAVTKRDITIPLYGLNNVAAIEYDYTGNCLYYADIHNDTINRLCLGSNATNEGQSQVVAMGRMQAVEGMAFDWMSRNIYWVDAGKKTINVARADGTFRRTLIKNPPSNTTYPLDKPRGIAVDPMHGYLFWTDWSMASPRIMRSWLDGQHVQPIIERAYVQWPNGIAVDIQTERIYWTDAGMDRIASATLNGTDIKVLVSGTYHTPHPYGITIFKDEVYWSDWQKQAILAANKYTGQGFHVVKSYLSRIMDVKYVHHAKQSGANKCTGTKRGCSHLCIGRPDDGTHGNSRTCLCPDGMTKATHSDGNEQCTCEDGQMFHTDGLCYPTANFTRCNASEFKCDNDRCVPSTWKCDKDNDCGDNSDERDCPYEKCRNGYFECKNSRCILDRWRCDHDDDCHDNSDEVNCPNVTCHKDQFMCNNRRCISKRWVCDGDDDCHDMSDEDVYLCRNRTIESTTRSPISCIASQFQCHNDHRCVPRSWVCDSADDCGDGSDEIGCATKPSNETACNPWQFRCNDGHCISKYWRCDGKYDCHDHSDENGCTTTSSPISTTYPTNSSHSCMWYQFHCRNGNCVHYTRECDGHDDCGDYSDEYNCHQNTTTSRPTTSCPGSQFTCSNGQCISRYSRCNGRYDCRDGSDERNCYTTTTVPATCSSTQFRCNNGQCIYGSWICDGDRDCDHGEDELNCHNGTACTGPNHFKCLYSTGCLPRGWVCDGDYDCPDRTDEIGCATNGTAITPVTTVAPAHCSHWQFRCYDGSGCISMYRRCNGNIDCLDASDETDVECKGELFVGGLAVIHHASTNITVGWEPPHQNANQTGTFKYIPSIRVAGSSTGWMNKTAITDTTHTFIHLEPYTNYAITIWVVAKFGTKVRTFTPVPPISIQTLQGKPTPPLHLVATVADLDTGKVKLTWHTPQKPNGVIGYYVVKYFNVSSNGQKGADNVRIVMPKDNTAYISHLSRGKKWNFTIQAMTVQLSDPSNQATIQLQSLAPFMTVTNLKAKRIKDDEWNLTWSLDPALIKKYSINNYEAECYTDHSNATYLKVSGNRKFATFTNLNPQTYYQCDVKVQNNLGYGPRSQTVDFTTSGLSIPNVGNVTLSLIERTKIKVSWTVARKGKWTYTVIYDYVGEHMIGTAGQNYALAKHVDTTNQWVVLKGLVGCEVYHVRVLVTGPNGWGTASEVKNKDTDFDETRKPKNIKVLDYNDPSSINVTWAIYCDRETESVEKLAYEIKITEVGGDTKFMAVKSSKNVTYSRIIKHLDRGATYNISVHPKVDGGKYGDYQIKKIKPYPAPRELAVHILGNLTYRATWTLDQDHPSKVPGYELWMRHQHDDGNTEYQLLASTKDLNFTFHLHWLQAKLNLTEDEVTKNHPKFSFLFEFRVRMILMHSHFSDFSQSEKFGLDNYFTANQLPSKALSTSNWIAICVSVVVVCLVLAVAFGVYFIRHRRLQRSFLSFANSHYDTRSGRTRFSTGDHDLDGEEDQPMITGFSDDEPLVIA